MASTTSSVLCRSTQSELLDAFLSGGQANVAVLPPALIIHGPSSTGKTFTLRHFLTLSSFKHTLVQCEECVTQRLLLQRCLRSYIADSGSTPPTDLDTSCDSFSSFMVSLEQFSVHASYTQPHLLVLDRIDRCMEPPTDLFAQFGRLYEQCSVNLCVVFVYSSPDPRTLLTSSIPHVYFPRYTQDEVVEILSTKMICQFPGEFTITDTAAMDFWVKYVKIVVDSIAAYTGTDIILIQEILMKIWTPFIAPLVSGQFKINEFIRLFRHGLHLFGDFAIADDLLESHPGHLLPSNIPLHSKYILIAAYLASFNESRYDSLFFSKLKHARADRRFGGRKVRGNSKAAARISNRMLAASPFDLERLLAILHAIYQENYDGKLVVSFDDEGKGETETSLASGALVNTIDVESQIATLISLRLIVKTGNGVHGDLLAGKVRLRCNVGWSFIAGLAKDIGMDVEGYILE
ncbi:hypothetical protein BABINDRAFT_160795 [Babjeviella inositovora NRRL Y-12698]|uniref:Uncharacterized protein n=1 Tax=Babjeviella inositovora NRRL Y-12698 TaxID=984486 RepID=A0A1E3QS62_9ASCO|nr:uncharacterized protein BABINDRAFT_160795 [Babjeviella inositovora NRRL Y-12698]ODQ80521.1 hypothetical protein BABINDRAFT_160795 [Babjeviella inositovora NRRL Y-12698]